MYADSNIAIPIAILSVLSKYIFAGKSSGNITAAANKTVIKGMPLQHSIKPMLKYLITGSSDLLPKAKITPKGKEQMMPKMARINVRAKPPHSLLSTISIPKDPRISPRATNGNTKIKKNKIYNLNLSFKKNDREMDTTNIAKLRFTLQIFSTG